MMSNLSGADLARLRQVLELVSSPLAYPTTDSWRSAVNRSIRDLLDADSAGFLLPVRDGLYLYSEEHDPAALARYPDLPPPSLRNGTTIFDAMVAHGPDTLANVYGQDFDLYLNSEYYQDYAGANGAKDTLGAVFIGPGGLSGIQLWHEHPGRRSFGDRERSLLDLIFPALRAGVSLHHGFQQATDNLLSVVDSTGAAIAFYGADGLVERATPGMDRLLVDEPEREVVWRAAQELIRSPNRSTPVFTAQSAYRLRKSRCSPTREMVVVERVSPVRKSARELKESYSLTPAEIRIARLLAVRRSNREIACSLFLSLHTVKRHTESILRKMRIPSRTDVGQLLIK